MTEKIIKTDITFDEIGYEDQTKIASMYKPQEEQANQYLQQHPIKETRRNIGKTIGIKQKATNYSSNWKPSETQNDRTRKK